MNDLKLILQYLKLTEYNVGHMDPPFDYSDIPEVIDFGLKTGYLVEMSFDDLANTLHKVYGKNNKELLYKYKESFIDGEKIIDYKVNSNGHNWLLITNYARIFKGGGGHIPPEIKEFNYWVLPKHIKLSISNSQTLIHKQYDNANAIAEDIYRLWGGVWKEEALKVSKKMSKKLKKEDERKQWDKSVDELLANLLDCTEEIEDLKAKNIKLAAENRGLRDVNSKLQSNIIQIKSMIRTGLSLTK